jgi:hypothetical protein
VPGFVCIKIGISDKPTDRFHTLVNNCGFVPLSFGTCNVRSRKVALKIETQLHRELKAWRTNGEWYRFHKSDKPKFAAIRDKILDPFRHSSWPLTIATHGVLAVIHEAKRRSLYFSTLSKRRGKAFQDFQSQSKSA